MRASCALARPRADGFRLDAIDRLSRTSSFATDPPATKPFPLPLRETRRGSSTLLGNRPEVGHMRAVARPRGNALLVGEVFRPVSEYARYLEVLDLVFGFDFLFSPGRRAPARRDRVGGGAGARRVGMSNHDFDRLASASGPRTSARGAPPVTLPASPSSIRVTRSASQRPAPTPYDRRRTVPPHAWEPGGGSRPVPPAVRSGSAGAKRRGTRTILLVLSLYRRLIELRASGWEASGCSTRPGVVPRARRDVVAVNTTSENPSGPRARSFWRLTKATDCRRTQA